MNIFIERYWKWGVAGIAAAGLVYLLMQDTIKQSRIQYEDAIELCKTLSENHSGVKDLYDECRDTYIGIQEKKEIDSDTYDPYEDAQPGGYGLE